MAQSEVDRGLTMKDLDKTKEQLIQELEEMRRRIDQADAAEVKGKQMAKELREKTRMNQTLLDAFPCVALLLRPSTREIVASNQAAVQAGAVPGARCFATWGQRENPCPWCLAPVVWAGGKAQHLEIAAIGIVWDAHWLPVEEDLYMHYAFDITERKLMEEQIRASLQEKEMLIREIHHRVKNNIQAMASMIRLQRGQISDERAISILREGENRIRSMGLVHEMLYQTEDLARIDFSSYLKQLVTHLWGSYGISAGRVVPSLDVEDVFLGLDTAIPCGLLVNELISNSLKHAFPKGQGGQNRD